MSISKSDPGVNKYRTVEEWREIIRKETRGKRSNFRILERGIFSSDAYLALSLPEAHILECFLNKLEYESPDRNGERRTGRKRGGALINGKDLVLTTNEIKARGKVKSGKTIAAARRRLIEIGFLDVVVSSHFPHHGVFAISDRWRSYPFGDYHPKDDRPAAFAPYPNIVENLERSRKGERKGEIHVVHVGEPIGTVGPSPLRSLVH